MLFCSFSQVLLPQQAVRFFGLLKAGKNAGVHLSRILPCSISSSAKSRDQVGDYARRKGMEMKEAERWLAPNLNYEA